MSYTDAVVYVRKVTDDVAAMGGSAGSSGQGSSSLSSAGSFDSDKEDPEFLQVC